MAGLFTLSPLSSSQASTSQSRTSIPCRNRAPDLANMLIAASQHRSCILRLRNGSLVSATWALESHLRIPVRRGFERHKRAVTEELTFFMLDFTYSLDFFTINSYIIHSTTAQSLHSPLLLVHSLSYIPSPSPYGNSDTTLSSHSHPTARKRISTHPPP